MKNDKLAFICIIIILLSFGIYKQAQSNKLKHQINSLQNKYSVCQDSLMRSRKNFESLHDSLGSLKKEMDDFESELKKLELEDSKIIEFR